MGAKQFEERARHQETPLGMPPSRPRHMLLERLVGNLVQRRVLDLEEDHVKRGIHRRSGHPLIVEREIVLPGAPVPR